MLQAGKRDQRVVLYDVTEDTTNDWGQPVQAPVEIGEFWAEVVPLLTFNQLAVRQVYDTATHQVTIAWLGTKIPSTPDNPYRQLRPRMKFLVLKDGSFLNIVKADNVDKENRVWVCICTEIVGATS